MERKITVAEAAHILYELQEENESLKTQLKHAKEDIEKRNQIIKILNKGYKHSHMTGKAVLDFSEEAKTMPYKDMLILQITLENIIKEVKGYED